MAFIEVTQAGTSTDILSVPWDKIFKVEGIVITNASSSSATVTLEENYTYNLGDSANTTGSRTLITVTIPANSPFPLPQLKGETIIGNLTITSDQTPVYVYVGVSEKH